LGSNPAKAGSLKPSTPNDYGQNPPGATIILKEFGVIEYWGNGQRVSIFHYSITPILLFPYPPTSAFASAAKGVLR
jgi:hypothetical protein